MVCVVDAEVLLLQQDRTGTKKRSMELLRCRSKLEQDLEIRRNAEEKRSLE